MIKTVIIAIICIFLSVNIALAESQSLNIVQYQQNVINTTFKKVVKTQRTLNKKITKSLKTIKNDKTPKTFLWALLLAFVYGTVHALGPGHAKGIIASYFLSTEEKLKKVPIVAFQTSMTHVITPVLLVVITDMSLRQIIINPEAQIYWFKLISYILIFFIGTYMLVKKILNFKKEKPKKQNSTTLAISAGLVPCVGSLIILLFTKANEMFLTGVFLVLTIGLGICFTLCSVGVASYFFRKIATVATKKGKRKIIINIIEFIGPVLIICLSIVMLLEVLCD